MTELKLKNYYSRVLKNFQSNAIFYRYFNQKKRYKETLNLLIKIIIFIKKIQIKTLDKIFTFHVINPILCMYP